MVSEKKQYHVIHAKKMVQGESVIENVSVIFSNQIEMMIPTEQYQSEAYQSEQSLNKIETETYADWLMPGFIDLHIHGANGADTMDGTYEALEVISQALVRSGTTAYLPTTMTVERERILKVLETVRVFQKDQLNQSAHRIAAGATVIGVHLEGPFINPIFKGAQAETHIQAPTEEWILPNLDVVKMVTFAPEMDVDFQFTKAMKDKGVLLAMGHSACDFETALKAYDEGVQHVTHCFNAVTGLHHRNPGVIGATLTKPFSVDVIADGIHIHPGFIGAFLKHIGVENSILITDSMRAAMMPEGEYDLGGQRVFVKDGACRLEDGTLAGSILTTDQALQNLIKWSDFKVAQVVQMLSENPAKKIGVFHEMGSLHIGKRANFVMMTNQFELQSVFVDGVKNV